MLNFGVIATLIVGQEGSPTGIHYFYKWVSISIRKSRYTLEICFDIFYEIHIFFLNDHRPKMIEMNARNAARTDCSLRSRKNIFKFGG